MNAPVRVGGSTKSGITGVGSPRENDDYLLLDPELGLFAVFDAGGSWSEMGGRAAPVGAEIIRRVIRDGTGTEPRELIERAFREAEEALRAEPDENGWWGACSVVLALLNNGRVHLSWLGDAVAHHVTGDQVELLTQPHTVWNEMVRRGSTPTNPNYRNLLIYSLGNAERPDPLEAVSVNPQPGDRLVLTTNGVTNHITADTTLSACRTIPDPTTCAEAIIEHAIMAGSRDNCTCAVIAFADGDFR
ncbi:MAG: protein phosphatase 2C domain-containing protein [Planctomycetes bacterium]|nr:protein phosphatase 2C domain-containing protein [Planctomycetota bacterium]